MVIRFYITFIINHKTECINYKPRGIKDHPQHRCSVEYGLCTSLHT